MTALKLTTIGISTGTVIPKEMLTRLKVGKGDTFYAIETPEGYLQGLLDSALARPQNTHAYNPHCTIVDLAAAYAYGYGLAKNHAFVDGNKRAAFLAIGLFLAINGYELKADQVDAIQAMLPVASGKLDEHGLAAWIRENSTPM